jgi:hypothetical protein
VSVAVLLCAHAFTDYFLKIKIYINGAYFIFSDKLYKEIRDLNFDVAVQVDFTVASCFSCADELSANHFVISIVIIGPCICLVPNFQLHIYTVSVTVYWVDYRSCTKRQHLFSKTTWK